MSWLSQKFIDSRKKCFAVSSLIIRDICLCKIVKLPPKSRFTLDAKRNFTITHLPRKYDGVDLSEYIGHKVVVDGIFRNGEPILRGRRMKGSNALFEWTAGKNYFGLTKM